MLAKLDLTAKVKKNIYRQNISRLQNRLYSLQVATWNASIPIVTLFEGWAGAGKAAVIQSLTEPLDPRGFIHHAIYAPNKEEKSYPWMRRYWLKIPRHGNWVFLERSWYRRVLDDRLEGTIQESVWREAYRDIVDFERTLTGNGYLVVKFFLHLNEPGQRKRLEKRSRRPCATKQLAREEHDQLRRYKDWLLAYEEMFEHTDTKWGPWHLVPAANRRYATLQVYETLVEVLKDKLGLNQLSLPHPSGQEHPPPDEDAPESSPLQDEAVSPAEGKTTNMSESVENA